MKGFTQAELDFVQKTYNQASDRRGNLIQIETDNPGRQSKVRQAAIETIIDQQKRIEDLEFFSKEKFLLEEVKAIMEAANELASTEESLNEAHELTLMALEADMSQLAQKIGQSHWFSVLRTVWNDDRYRGSRSPYLTPNIPEEVIDDFNVLLFNTMQGWLSWRVYILGDIIKLKSLNTDDYWPGDDVWPSVFSLGVFGNAQEQAKVATYNYIELQELKEEERAARRASEVSIGGKIWEVIGWDSPTDFLADMVLFTLTGGASKIYRWGKKLYRVSSRARKVTNKLERLLQIRKRAHTMELRVQEIRATAEKLKQANKMLRLPQEIFNYLKIIQTARGKIRLMEDVAKVATMDFIRGVVSSISAQSAFRDKMNIGSAATKELALTSMRAFLDGWSLGRGGRPIGEQIEELRNSVNFTQLIKGHNSKNSYLFLAYLAVLTARDFLARMVLTLSNNFSLNVEYIKNELIDSVAAALEISLRDLPIMTKYQKKELVRAVISTIRKTLAEIGKEMASKLM